MSVCFLGIRDSAHVMVACTEKYNHKHSPLLNSLNMTLGYMGHLSWLCQLPTSSPVSACLKQEGSIPRNEAIAKTQVCYQHYFGHKYKAQTDICAIYLYTIYEEIFLFLHLVSFLTHLPAFLCIFFPAAPPVPESVSYAMYPLNDHG